MGGGGPGTKAKLKLNSAGLELDRLAIGDLAGASLDLSGRMQGPWNMPQGTFALALSGQRLDGVTAILDKLAPQAAETLRGVSAQLVPAKLQATLVLGRAPLTGDRPLSTAKIRVDGTAGPLRIVLTGEGTGNPLEPQTAALRGEGQLDASDGRALAALLGINALVAAGDGPGMLRFSELARLAALSPPKLASRRPASILCSAARCTSTKAPCGSIAESWPRQLRTQRHCGLWRDVQGCQYRSRSRLAKLDSTPGVWRSTISSPSSRTARWRDGSP